MGLAFLQGNSLLTRESKQASSSAYAFAFEGYIASAFASASAFVVAFASSTFTSWCFGKATQLGESNEQ